MNLETAEAFEITIAFEIIYTIYSATVGSNEHYSVHGAIPAYDKTKFSAFQHLELKPKILLN